MLQEIDQAMERMGSLNHTLPRVMQVVNNLNSSARDLVRVITMDPVLTARVLRVANSPYFAMREPVTNLRRATILMGMNTIRNLALATAVRSNFEIRSDCMVSSEDFWRYTVGCAVLSDQLARRAAVNRPTAEEAFVIGMLHPIGRALFIQHFPAQYNQVIAQAKEQRTPTEPQEMKVFSTDNKAVGLRMVARWKLPHNVADGISFYTEPHRSALKSTHILSIACHHIKQRRVGYCGDWVNHYVSDEVYANLRLTRVGVEQLVDDVLDEELAKADDFIKGI
jgi:HD-like signal output (HDOD) protein